jgi:hypothetical protein
MQCRNLLGFKEENFMEYRAITSENFYYNEMKKVARAVVENPAILEELREYLLEKDLMDSTSEYNFKKKLGAVKKRINVLTPELIKSMAEEDPNIGRFINFYSILLNERIILEFMDEVVKPKYYGYDSHLYESEIIGFILEKGDHSEKVHGWSEAAKKKMAVKIKNFMKEAGYLLEEKGELVITRPIIPYDIIEMIGYRGHKNILAAMLYEDRR